MNEKITGSLLDLEDFSSRSRSHHHLLSLPFVTLTSTFCRITHHYPQKETTFLKSVWMREMRSILSEMRRKGSIHNTILVQSKSFRWCSDLEKILMASGSGSKTLTTTSRSQAEKRTKKRTKCFFCTMRFTTLLSVHPRLPHIHIELRSPTNCSASENRFAPLLYFSRWNQFVFFYLPRSGKMLPEW